MSKLLLIKPPERARFSFGAFSLATLAAAVRDRAEVVIIDATDLTIAETTRQAWAQAPDLVGVTVMGVESVPSACTFLEALVSDPSARRETLVLAGGHGATVIPSPLLKSGAQAVVVGEGEATLRDLIERGLDSDTPGIVRVVGGSLAFGPRRSLITPLDSLRVPARDLMPPPRDGVHLLETSRGCPHCCSFCETSRFHRSRWRAHSPAWVAAEVARTVEEYNAWVILMADDNFAASSARLIEICERIAEGPQPATFIASARADDLLRSPALIPALASARVFRMMVGVETLDPRTAQSVGKSIPLQAYQEVFARLAANGIFSLASFIVGLPGESTNTDELLELAVSAGSDAAAFVPFLPMAGTPLADGRVPFATDPEHVQRADVLTSAFRCHADVQRRLQAAADLDGMRAIMARATLEQGAL